MLASLLAATLLISSPFALDAKKEAEVTCTGPTGVLLDEVHCLCFGEQYGPCFDEYGCKRQEDGGFTWRDVLLILGTLISIGTPFI